MTGNPPAPTAEDFADAVAGFRSRINAVKALHVPDGVHDVLTLRERCAECDKPHPCPTALAADGLSR